jgi:hypothetical protein
MKILAWVLTVGSCLIGLFAAYLWFKASGIGPQFTGVEPGTSEGSQSRYLSAIARGSDAAALQNRRAAFWTGISVGLSGMASGVNLFG